VRRQYDYSRWEMKKTYKDGWWYAFEVIGHAANLIERLGVKVRGDKR
jgi:hypothetical protein